MTVISMLHVPVSLDALARYADDRSWTRRRGKQGQEADASFDQGRALHHVLDEAFGPGRLRPFRLMAPRGKSRGAIYAYTTASKDELIDAFNSAAPPESSSILTIARLATKDMPDAWAKGRRLGFDVRVRPVMRVKGNLPVPRQPGKFYQKGHELDAFFVEAQRSWPDSRPRITSDGEGIPSGMILASRTREAVYRDWLAARLEGAAELDPARTTMTGFERAIVARDGHRTEGPDATFQGELTITDPAAFASLLAGGVGRHKAYGYGMLLLRQLKRR